MSQAHSSFSCSQIQFITQFDNCFTPRQITQNYKLTCVFTSSDKGKARDNSELNVSMHGYKLKYK